MNELYTFFRLYEHKNKPIPNHIDIDGKKGFLYPGYAVIINDKIYTIPTEVGTFDVGDVQWIVDTESVNVRFKA